MGLFFISVAATRQTCEVDLLLSNGYSSQDGKEEFLLNVFLRMRVALCLQRRHLIEGALFFHEFVRWAHLNDFALTENHDSTSIPDC